MCQPMKRVGIQTYVFLVACAKLNIFGAFLFAPGVGHDASVPQHVSSIASNPFWCSGLPAFLKS